MSSLRGASLYSGIFGDEEGEAAKDNDAAAATTTTTADSSTPAADAASTKSEQNKSTGSAPAWSAALRFAPRKSAAASNKAKPRPSAALLASFAPPLPADAPGTGSTGGVSQVGAAKAPAASSAAGSHPSPSSQPPAAMAAASHAATGEASAPRPSHEIGLRANPSIASIQTTAIRLPGAASEAAAALPAATPVHAPPPTTLPPEVLERDRQLARAAAEARGDRPVQRRGGPSADADDDRWDEEGGWEGEDDEDVNGFLASSAGKKASKKKKNKRKRGVSPPTGPNMDHDYDPRVPNDYIAYRELVAKRRQAELTAIREEQRRHRDDKCDDGQSAGRRSGFGSRARDEWSDEEGPWGQDDDDDAKAEERRRKLSRFAPPPSYGQRAESSSQPPSYSAHTERPLAEGGAPAARPPPPPPPAAPTTSFASSGAPRPRPPPALPPPSTGEEAYARRVAATAAMTGEEAYQRRLALSQAQTGAPAMRPPRPPPPPPPLPPPLSSSVPPSNAGLPPPPSLDATGAMDLEARQSAAAAIAARLAKALPPGPPPPRPPPPAPADEATATTGPPAPQNPHDFAARLMNKYGYQEGQGIGAEGNKGILTPLLSTSSGKGRGTIQNEREEAKRREERERFGDVSNAVVLYNLVKPEELEDEREREEVLGEIREECSKHGYISSLSPLLPSSTSSAQERQRGVGILVEYTGEAGAWRAVRALDGRFFAGQTVRARFYHRPG